LEISGEQLVITAAGRSGGEDALEITPEVELHPSLPPSKRDEASTNQKQLQAQTQVLSGPKRAGEPKVIAAPAESAEDENILELTAEDEFHVREEILELTAELELHEVEDTLNLKPEPHRKPAETQAQVMGSERACEPKREEIIAALAGNAEDEDILELTAEVELHQHKEMLELTTALELQEYEEIFELTDDLELQEHEEIYELTYELELHEVKDTLKTDSKFNFAPSSKLDEASTQVVSGPGRTSQPTRDVIIVTPAGSAEDEDILDLTPANQTPTVSPKRVGEPRTEEMIAAPAGTPELELHPSPRPSMRDRTQRAREPTREEIIAAMRQFISDE
jgi:hypothetical protein